MVVLTQRIIFNGRAYATDYIYGRAYATDYIYGRAYATDYIYGRAYATTGHPVTLAYLKL
jgi:hypothetical protein